MPCTRWHRLQWQRHLRQQWQRRNRRRRHLWRLRWPLLLPLTRGKHGWQPCGGAWPLQQLWRNQRRRHLWRLPWPVPLLLPLTRGKHGWQPCGDAWLRQRRNQPRRHLWRLPWPLPPRLLPMPLPLRLPLPLPLTRPKREWRSSGGVWPPPAVRCRRQRLPRWCRPPRPWPWQSLRTLRTTWLPGRVQRWRRPRLARLHQWGVCRLPSPQLWQGRLRTLRTTWLPGRVQRWRPPQWWRVQLPVAATQRLTAWSLS